MKKLFAFFLALISSAGIICASDTSVDGIWYDFNSSTLTASVTYQGSLYSNEYSGSIVIPSSVMYNSNTYNVTSIGDYAFYYCSGLTSVTIPNSVTSIGSRAFQGCSGLTSVTIPNSVTSIGYYAFDDCSGLTSVTIPNSVTSIGNSAFYGCTGLTSPVYNAHVFAYMPTSYSGAYTIPNGIETIAGSAFNRCTGLTSVTIGNSVTSIGNSAFYGCTGLTSVTIPNSVTSIGDGAFQNCSGLTSVTIPNSVTCIGDRAFLDCSGLTSVTIPNSVTRIGEYTFDGCTGLTSVTIPNSVTSIGDRAFSVCTGLTSVTIPNSVTSIGNYAFDLVTNIVYSGTATGSPWGAKSVNGYVDGCLVYSDSTKTNLLACSSIATGEIVIPNSVTSIGDRAFSGCTGLTSPVYNAHVFAYMPTSYSGAYTIPNGIETIAGSAFAFCSSLTSITIPNSVTSLGRSAFSFCTSLTSVTISNSVTSIGESAFSNCSSLTSVTIPNSVTSIGEGAFWYCYSLTSVTIGNSVTSIGNSAFYGCSGLTSVEVLCETPPSIFYPFYDCTNLSAIYVPCGTSEVYKNSWSSYQNLIKYNSFEYTVNGDVNLSNAGNVIIPMTICDGNIVTAVPNDGYHFVQWSDGNTDNPRSFVLTQDTTFTAEFAKNTYTVTTESSNTAWGITTGDTTALYLDEVTLTATPNYGYQFTQWSDSVTDNPRTIVLTQDSTFTAIFVSTDRITVAQALSIGAELANNASTETQYTICGYVSAVDVRASDAYSSQYGNQSFYVADTLGSTAASNAEGAFYVYRGIPSTGSAIPYGTYVEFTCSIKKYVGSNGIAVIENTNHNIDITVMAGPGVMYDTLSVSEAVVEAFNLGDDEVSAKNYAIIGYVARIYIAYSEQYGSISFYMTDETTTSDVYSDLQVYRGAISAEDGATLAVGDPVLVIGKLSNNFFNNHNSAEVTDGAQVTKLQSYYRVTTITDQNQGSVSLQRKGLCTTLTLTATPNYGYHFVQWSDSVTDNPRTFVLTQDTMFTAEFTKNTYSITTQSSNSEWGITLGGTSALYLDEIQISATPNYGYHFTHWSDGNTDNPRTIIVTEDKTYTATFAKNIYEVTKQYNSEQGYITGVTQAEYLDYVTLTAVPNYGYHFTQWSDDNTDNPRTFVLTQDTTFTAEFAIDRTGLCGNGWALVWTYDPEAKELTISGDTAFNENMQCGIEARTELQSVVFDEGVTSVGVGAFANCATLQALTISSTVKKISENAFYNCENLISIYNYRTTPTNAYSTAFDGVDKFECVLYVPAPSITLYQNAAVWRDFYYILPIQEAPTSQESLQMNEEQFGIKKLFRDGQVLILRDGKVYTTTGQEVK